MKTDQAMTVTLDKDLTLSIYHKSEMGNLTQLWHDVSRHYRSRSPSMNNWLSNERTQRFIAKTAELTGKPTDELVRASGKGRSACTWAHLNVIIFALEYISPEINAVVIDEFVRHRILAWRDDSGDKFIEMNVMLKLKADSVIGRPADRSDYVAVAWTIKNRINPNSGDWNQATASQLAERSRIESQLTSLLKLNLVRDWDHLKELAATA